MYLNKADRLELKQIIRAAIASYTGRIEKAKKDMRFHDALVFQKWVDDARLIFNKL